MNQFKVGLLFVSSLLFFNNTFGQTNKTAETSIYSEKTLKNIEADKILLNVFEIGDVSQLDAIIAPDFVNHQAVGDLHGLDSLKIGVGKFHTMMGTVKLELKRRWADDEFVNDWVKFSSPDSKIVIEGMEVTRYVNGKAVEHFFFPNGQTPKH